MNPEFAELVRRYQRSPEFSGRTLDHPNAKGATGDTLLHAAVVRGALDDVNSLIELGASVNEVGDLGNTPLHHAASRGHVEIIKKLIAFGAKTTIRNEFGESPLDLAVLMNRTEAVKILKKA